MFDDVSPVKKAAAFMVFMFMIALMVFTKAYLPYVDYLKLVSQCDEATTGTISEVIPVYKEDGLYYGPVVEFVLKSNSYFVRSEAISPIKSGKEYTEGQTVNIVYNSDINSDVIITDDTSCYDRYRVMVIVAAVIAFIGFADFIINVYISVNSTGKGSVKKFKATPDGKSFKEWQEMQKLIEAAKEREESVAEAAAAQENESGDAEDTEE